MTTMTDPMTTPEALTPQGEPRQPKRGRGRPRKDGTPAQPKIDLTKLKNVGAGRDPEAPAPEADPKAKGGRPTVADTRDRELIKNVADAYRQLGGMMQLAAPLAILVAGPEVSNRLNVVGVAVSAEADSCAAALVKWSRTNARVRKILEGIGQGSGIAAVALAHVPIVMAVAMPAPASIEGADLGLATLLSMMGGMPDASPA